MNVDIIFTAIRSSNLPRVQALIKQDRSLLNALHLNDSPLICAARHNRLVIAEWLLDQGAQVDMEVWRWGERTALEAACSHGRLDMVRLLISRGAEPTRMNHRRQSALTTAACKDHPAIVEELLRHVPSLAWFPDHKDALMGAARHGAVGPMTVLLVAGGDPSVVATKAEGRRYFFWCTEEKADAFRALLQVGAWGTLGRIPVPRLHRAMCTDHPPTHAPTHSLRTPTLLFHPSFQAWHLRRSLVKARSLADSSYTVSHTALVPGARTRAQTGRVRVETAPAYVVGRLKRHAQMPRVEVKGLMEGRGRGKARGGRGDGGAGGRAEVVGQALGGLKTELFEELMRLVAP
jgi:hypothetical protein